VGLLKSPRRVMLMVKAAIVDQNIELLLPHLEKGDIIIDGGNSLFTDSIRRTKYLAEKGILFIGTGVSAAKKARAWAVDHAGRQSGGVAVCEGDFTGDLAKSRTEHRVATGWRERRGHYVKMVHNGIEYGDIQLIGEAYQLLKDALGLTPDELHDVFAEWNKGELDSYLIEISTIIFGRRRGRLAWSTRSWKGGAEGRASGRDVALDLAMP